MQVDGSITIPGDKSITHRALMLAAMARGASELTGALAAQDTRSTARVLRQLGARVGPLGRGRGLRILGQAWHPPVGALHCGNSGTTARLMVGLLAGKAIQARLTGDASLKRRPMSRVLEPLDAMGATFTSREGRLPVTVRGGVKRGLVWESPVASAQIKTALLFAAMTGNVPLTFTEPWRSRDHTERLFAALGIPLDISDRGVTFTPRAAVELDAFNLEIPGDVSSAAFPLGAAVLATAGALVIRGVGVNPTRTGVLDVLARMGAPVVLENERVAGTEPVADLVARPARLRGVTVTPEEVPRLVDEIPLLAVLASRASGESVFQEVGELRVKESDRLALIADNLRAVGGDAEVQGDHLVVRGGERPPVGRVETAGDHRLAMAFAVLGTVPGADITLSESRSPGVSFPGFFDMLREIEA
jgi:3-phosphoshikimate 1-carboxyvinyltransferase